MKRVKFFCVILIMSVFFLALTACGKEASPTLSKKVVDFENETFTVQQAYAYAADLGFTGTLEDFIALLSGKDGEDGKNGNNGKDGKNGENGQDGVGITTLSISADGHLLVTLTNNQTVDCGALPTIKGEKGEDGKDGKDGLTPYIGENGNWWIGETDTGTPAGAEDTVFITGKCGENTSWTLHKDGRLFISGEGDMEYAPWQSFCALILEVSIEEGVNNIVHDAFSGCNLLTKITISDTVTEIGEHAFYNCDNLKNLNIPDSVTDIYISMFFGCYQLTEISLGKNVRNRESLSWAELTYGGGNEVTTINYAGTKEKWFEFESATIAIETQGGGAGLNAKLFDEKDLVVHCADGDVYPNGKNYTDESGIRYRIYEVGTLYVGGVAVCQRETAVATVCGYNGNATAVVIPSEVDNATVTEINGAFDSDTDLIEIVIPESVIMITNYAFYGCKNLKNVTILGEPEFREWSFYGNCPIENVTGSLAGCKYIANVAGNTLQTVVITSGTSIGSEAFCNCGGLTSITIPDSVTSIGRSAFSCCDNLTSITYQGTIAQWNAVEKENGWKSNTIVHTIHCADGDIEE